MGNHTIAVLSSDRYLLLMFGINPTMYSFMIKLFNLVIFKTHEQHQKCWNVEAVV